MAIALRFSKNDISVPWGFRLVGGVDFDQPIVVVKVNPDSLAESAGLQVGDIIVRVNDTPTAGLTHDDVHNLLFSSGLEFELGIRRGEIMTRIISDENYDIEECNAIRRTIEEDVLNEAVNIINNMKNSIDSIERQTNYVSENLSGQEEIVNTVTLQATSDVKKGNKWSTFLVKPEKPVPPKKVVVKEEPKDEPYRVVIKKQSRRPSQEKKVQFDQNITQVEIDFESEETQTTTQVDSRALQSVEVEVKVIETEEIEIEETETSRQYNIEDAEEEIQQEYFERGITRNSIQEEEESESSKSELKIDLTPSLEEQLLAVQKQLQALSQLPSAIQLTLDAVSKQLASIVGAKENAERNGDLGEYTSSSKDEEEEEPQTEEEYLEDTSISEKAELELIREDDDANSVVAEELEEDVEKGGRIEEEVAEEIEEQEPDPYAGLTDEEKEERIRQEQLAAKKQKTMEERTLKPIQRPIILPGGRKWSNPEDAIPSFRKPKMSDDKIIETIESNLEVNHWNNVWPWSDKVKPVYRYCSDFWKIGMIHYDTTHSEVKESNCWMVPSRVVATKHINFLKYQPPPKNLDYLQRSEVYRLVHDMEPPVRGITSRPEKVAAVQDYYEATREVP